MLKDQFIDKFNHITIFLEIWMMKLTKIAILVGDDVSFPELARIAAGKGALTLFVPFNTDIRSGYMRIRSCAAARCIENGMYAVLAGPIGNLPFVQGGVRPVARIECRFR